MSIWKQKKATAQRRRGFTIVELLVVIAVLAVLMGIVSTAASAVIRKSRARKNEALRTLLQQGIATFQAQEDYWPPDKGGKLQRWYEDGLGGESGVLSETEYDAIMQKLIGDECIHPTGKAVMDVNGFMVASSDSVSRNKDPDGNPKCSATDVSTWVKRVRAKTAKSNNMVFGYTNSERGYFRRFRIQFNPETGIVKVLFARKNKGTDHETDDK